MRLLLCLLPVASASFLSIFNFGRAGHRAPAEAPLSFGDYARQGLGLFSYFSNIRRDAAAPQPRRRSHNLLSRLSALGDEVGLPKIPFLEGVPVVPGVVEASVVGGSLPGAGECLPRGIPFISRSSPSFFQNILRTFPGTQDFLRSFQTYPDGLEPASLMGKWHWVLITPAVHARFCATTELNALTEVNSTWASFGTVDHFREGGPDGPPKLSFGYGLRDRRKISLYSQADPCPYEVVVVGPKSRSGQYEYVVLSNWAKYPVIGLARDVRTFYAHHRLPMEATLRKQGYINLLTQSLGSVQYADWSQCRATNAGNVVGNLINGILFG